MKLVIRVSALTLVFAAAIVGNSLPKISTVAAIHQGTVPGPSPYCNPYIEKCSNIR